MVQAGLVLEGGGMRGVYTSGVLDFFLDNGIMFSSCYGVSAGACNACSYLSKQRGRGYHVIVDYLDDKNYCSFYSLVKTGDLFGVDMAYNKIPNEMSPYDYKTYDEYQGKFYAVATEMETGEAAYLQVVDMHEDITAVRASASLPWVSRNVEYKGKEYLDGGVADSIPLKRAIEDGNEKNIVILTRDPDYQKKEDKLAKFANMKYKKYPKLVEAMKNRHIAYNETLAYMKQMSEEGKAFVIQPEEPVKVRRIEKNRDILKKYYTLGYDDARKQFPKIKEYLGI